ncbi:MAG: GNAT family N-acetyltransferase [Neisseriaceae bacterium]|nr:GNAT family N-acetyltransferase [Neisseriaceae bacterium]
MTDVIIRAIAPSDAEALRALFAQPEVCRQTLHLPYTDQGEWQRRTLPSPAGTHKLVAVLDDQVVGMIGLVVESNARRRHVASIGIGVDQGFIRRGIGRGLIKAVIALSEQWLNLRRLELTVFTDNVGAISLYEQCGFVIEGTSRGYAFRDGADHDVYQMAYYCGPEA